MADQETSKYRQRIETETGGLARDEERFHAGAGGLTFEKIEGATPAVPLALASMADQMLPADAGNEEDIGDFGVGVLLAEHRTGRAGELLEKARQLVSGGQYRPALPVIEEALAADGGSGQAWALKARCLNELGLHEAALRVLHHARTRISDTTERILILKLEADCVRATTRALDDQLIELAGKNRLAEALNLVEDGLRRQPSNIVFLYHLANLKWLSGDREGAVRAIEEARRHVGGESVDSIDELERKIEFGPHWQAVEAARSALRKADHGAAIRHLESCAILQGNEQFEGLRAYAEQRRRTLRPLLGGRGAAQSGAARQQTLRWLLAEEIRQADGALRAGEYSDARAVLERAADIDAGCAAVWYKHARAIFLFYRRAMEQKSSLDTRTVTEDLKTAENLAIRAKADSSYQEHAQSLVKSIQGLRVSLR